MQDEATSSAAAFWDDVKRAARARHEPRLEPGVPALGLARAIPGLMGRFTPVDGEHWADAGTGCLVACPCDAKPHVSTGRFKYCTGCYRFYLFDGLTLWVAYGLAPDVRCKRCGDEISAGAGHCPDCAGEFLTDVEGEVEDGE